LSIGAAHEVRSRGVHRVVIVGGPPARAAAPPDPEATLEFEFTFWAGANGVLFDRLSCDVTTA